MATKFLLRRFRSYVRNFHTATVSRMDLKDVVKSLETIAPSSLAEQWDNVGLLIEPTSPHKVKNILLTNDLTEEVMQEALSFKANMIISYHPPIFRPLKRVTSKSWKERLVISALENRVAVYSPHTASDAVINGVNDWLASGIGEIGECKPIKSSMNSSSGGLIYLKPTASPAFADLAKSGGDKIQTLSHTDSGILAYCDSKLNVYEEVQKIGVPCEDVISLPSSNRIIPKTGAGRLCKLIKPLSLEFVIGNLKSHLNLKNLRLAIGKGKTLKSLVNTVALCAGSGSSVLSGCTADIYLTGEMSHHDVLDATQNGISVILSEHSNSERGYLHVLKNYLSNSLKCSEIDILVSVKDRDPLEIV